MYKCVFISLDFGLLWIVCHIQFSDVLNYRNLGWGLGHIHDIYYCRIEGYIYYRLTRTSLYIVFYDKWIAIWFVLINLCFNHFNEKTYWTSEILGEDSWKKFTFVVDEFFFGRCRRSHADWPIKTNNNCQEFFQEYSPRMFEVQQVFSEKYTTYRVISVFFFVLDRKRLETIKNGLDLGMSISQSNQ